MIYFTHKTAFGLVCLGQYGHTFRTFLIQESVVTMPHKFHNYLDALADYDLRTMRGF